MLMRDSHSLQEASMPSWRKMEFTKVALKNVSYRSPGLPAITQPLSSRFAQLVLSLTLPSLSMIELVRACARRLPGVSDQLKMFAYATTASAERALTAA
jgi:hypothetical protein